MKFDEIWYFIYSTFFISVTSVTFFKKMFQYFSSQLRILLILLPYYKLKAFDVAQIETLPTAECHESFNPKIQFNL